MPRRDRTADRRATLYTRGDLPRPASERRDAVVATLAEVAAEGELCAFDVVTWDKRVPKTCDGPEATRSQEFRAWAENAGASLDPCFDTRECYAEDTGRRRTELVMPVMCLAIYEDDELVEVAPRTTDDGVVTVRDCLDRLERHSEANRDDRAVPA